MQEEPKAMVIVDGESVDWTAHAEDEKEDFAFMDYGNSSSDSESELEKQPLYDRFVTSDGMHAVPPPMTGNYMPSGPDVEIDEFYFDLWSKQQPNHNESETTL
ncbi:hypothetical protein Tco_0563750 [Tanacetum coccineum]